MCIKGYVRRICLFDEMAGEDMVQYSEYVKELMHTVEHKFKCVIHVCS